MSSSPEIVGGRDSKATRKKKRKTEHQKLFEYVWGSYEEMFACDGHSIAAMHYEFHDAQRIAGVVRSSPCEWLADIDLAVKAALKGEKLDPKNPEHQAVCAREFIRRRLLPVFYFKPRDCR